MWISKLEKRVIHLRQYGFNINEFIDSQITLIEKPSKPNTQIQCFFKFVLLKIESMLSNLLYLYLVNQ